MPHLRRATLALALTLLGCGPDGAIVAAPRLQLNPPVEGKLTVTGGPGAVVGSGVTTVTLTVLEAATATYRVQHAGSHLAVASSYGAIAPDGSFGPVSLGTSYRPVKSGDELVITPQVGTAQAGRPVTVIVP